MAFFLKGIMETTVYENVRDREGWRSGPWDHEPQDKVQWQDQATGLPCLAVRNNLGAWCGYVGVAPGHPQYDVHYGSDSHADLRVHGGITFSERCVPGATEAGGICHVPGEGEEHDIFWLGFDCSHYMDLTPARISRSDDDDSAYRTLDYVKAECASLAKQLKGMTDGKTD